MITDEYTHLPDEYQPTEDEFNYPSGKTEKSNKKATQKAKNHKRSIMQLMMTATVFFSVGKSSAIGSNAPAYVPDSAPDAENVTVWQQDNSGEENSLLSVESPVASDESKQYEIILIDCTSCNGTGTICDGDPNFGWDRGNGRGYAGCGGTGIAPCPDINCNGGMYTCPDCNGSGADQYGVCEICSGRGVYPHEEFCMGTGFIECMTADGHRTCEECSGTGKIETQILKGE